MDVPIPHRQFWASFLDATRIGDAAGRFQGVVTFEDDLGEEGMGDGDGALAQVLSGAKTAAADLFADYRGAAAELPRPGGLSIVLDASGHATAVIETVAVSVESFADIDDSFARACGQGYSIKTWRRHCRAHLAARARAAGTPFGEGTELVCHRFRLVFAPAASG